jgi:hypothetical protein
MSKLFSSVYLVSISQIAIIKIIQANKINYYLLALNLLIYLGYYFINLIILFSSNSNNVLRSVSNI